MQRIKETLLRNSGAITLGLGITNLWVWIVHTHDPFFLFLGFVMTGLGALEWAAEVDKHEAE